MKNFSRRVLRIIAFLVVPLIASATAPMLSACGGGAGNCCKVCSEGEACGDSCIAKNETCTKGAGCACNG
jgi:hypothetical protein